MCWVELVGHDVWLLGRAARDDCVLELLTAHTARCFLPLVRIEHCGGPGFGGGVWYSFALARILYAAILPGAVAAAAVAGTQE